VTSLGAQVAVIHDGRVLLTKREDFEVWCLPGGSVDAGETPVAAARREVAEETGLDVEITRFVGMYLSLPEAMPEFATYAMLFAARIVGGALRRQTAETTDAAFFSPADLPDDMIAWQRGRVFEAFGGAAGYVRTQRVRWQAPPGFDAPPVMSRADLYAMRDATGLSRRDFFMQHMNRIASDTLDVAAVAHDSGRPVVIADYDPAWPGHYAREADRIRERVAGAVVAIEHIGSTAVPGLAAKPIIDIMIGVDSLAIADAQVVPAMIALGYDYVAAYERDMPFRRYFRRFHSNGQHSHHVHLVPVDHPFFRRHIAFRDALRASTADRDAYAALKRSLAAAFTSEQYTDRKTAFIHDVLTRHGEAVWQGPASA
jgi:GrpB-like predicted nucleotidyltransferase (UPF0157 family)/ADP-ribose pyrophosphatase YjhB (NUDIX family)